MTVRNIIDILSASQKEISALEMNKMAHDATMIYIKGKKDWENYFYHLYDKIFDRSMKRLQKFCHYSNGKIYLDTTYRPFYLTETRL